MIKIEDLLPLLKKGYVAMNKNGDWWWSLSEPVVKKESWSMENPVWVGYIIDIAPYDGDWKDSLMECGK